MVHLHNGRVVEAEAGFRDAARLMEARPEGADPGELPVILNNLAAALTLRGESARAIPVLRRALYLLDPGHSAAPAVATNLARALIDEGEFAEAAPLVERALEAGRERRSGELQACALGLLAQIDLHEKQPERALVHAGMAMELTGQAAPALASRIRWIRAQALAAAGRKSEASAEVWRLLKLPSAGWTPAERRILEHFYQKVTNRKSRKRSDI